MTARINEETQVGAVFAGKPKTLSYERLWAFSGGPFAPEGWPKKNLHTDPETAGRVGLSRPIVSGTQFQGHIVELFMELFGPAWYASGSMDVRFVRGVGAGDTVTAMATVTGREEVNGGIRFDMDVSCVLGDNDPALVGTATGVLA